ncbi:hypothetical protein [Dactylosporangium sp. CA-139066]|uniref:hypothetical protein n=1 Tax=Dactylosporangium sp. CA-139066 TaxID=3239930 RepID=UPI003D8D1AA4
MRRELRIFAAIGRALRRRREVGADERAVAYGGQLRPLLIGVVALSAVEIAAVELLVPWAVVRWVLAVLGAYGLLWAVGVACSVYTRPHTIGPDGLRLRFAAFTELDVPARRLVPAGTAPRGSHRRTVEVDGGTLSFSVLGQTNLAVRIEPPAELGLGRAGRHRIDTVRFYADDPAAALEPVTQ